MQDMEIEEVVAPQPLGAWKQFFEVLAQDAKTYTTLKGSNN